MVRYKKGIVLLIFFAACTLVLIKQWLPLRIKKLNTHHLTPVNRYYNAHENIVDIKSVSETHDMNGIIEQYEEISSQSQQSTTVRYGDEVIARYEDLNENMNINGSILKLNDKQTSTDTLCKSCRTTKPVFIKENKPFVALASFPGSGNSWTRELLEYVTGVYTGSIYIDGMGKFTGSQRCPLRGGVYIVKTHKYENATKHRDCNRMPNGKTIYYETAMFILRNPYDALLSLFNLIKGGKVGFASQQTFKTKWKPFVEKTARGWKKMTLYWMTTFERPVHVIVYEKLKKETPNELFKIGKFVNFNSTYLDLYCAKSCLKPKYHRVNKPEWMNITTLYDDQSKRVVNGVINGVINAVDGKGHDIVDALKSYLMDSKS